MKCTIRFSDLKLGNLTDAQGQVKTFSKTRELLKKDEHKHTKEFLRKKVESK